MSPNAPVSPVSHPLKTNGNATIPAFLPIPQEEPAHCSPGPHSSPGSGKQKAEPTRECWKLQRPLRAEHSKITSERTLITTAGVEGQEVPASPRRVKAPRGPQHLLHHQSSRSTQHHPAESFLFPSPVSKISEFGTKSRYTTLSIGHEPRQANSIPSRGPQLPFTGSSPLATKS